MSETPRHSVDVWLEKAESDMRLVRRLSDDDDPALADAAVFHCQQAVEKLLKAALVARGVEPPRVHDLADLARRVQAAGFGWSWALTDLRTLSVGAVQSRYPGYRISPEEMTDALRITGAIWASLRPLL